MENKKRIRARSQLQLPGRLRFAPCTLHCPMLAPRAHRQRNIYWPRGGLPALLAKMLQPQAPWIVD